MGACVGDLAQGLGLAPSTVSHHLKELRRTGLISMSRRGRKVECTINAGALQELSALIETYQPSAGSLCCTRCSEPTPSEAVKMKQQQHGVSITYCV